MPAQLVEGSLRTVLYIQRLPGTSKPPAGCSGHLAALVGPNPAGALMALQAGQTDMSHSD